jgi:peptide/nickel transport system permease protein
LLRRLIALVLLVIGITLITFALTNLVPANPALANLGQRAGEDPKAVAAFNRHYGLDLPLPQQYGLYMLHLVQGDLGQSEQSHRPVLDDLKEYVPATAELALTSIVIAALLGIPLGVLAAVRRNGLTDQVRRVISLGGVSVPSFWLALIALYVFFFKLGWAPGSGRLDPIFTAPPTVTGFFTIDALLAGEWDTFVNAFAHLILPALVLALPNIALLTRYTRSAVLDVINNDYVQAARAKGLPEVVVLVRHVLRAAAPSISTVAGLAFANVMTGTVLVENIFSWPGLGQYAYRAATTIDLPSIMGVTLLVAVVYVIVNLLVDLAQVWIDPRLRLT